MRKNLVNTAFSVTGVIIIAKILAFVRQMVTASAFGATIETDLISLSQTFITDFEYVMTQTMITAFIAIYVRISSRGSSTQRFVSNTIKLILYFSVAVSLILVLLSSPISKILAPTYDVKISYRLSKYVSLFSPVLILFSLESVFQSLLNANERFNPGQVIGINQSIIMIVLIYTLKEKFGIATLVLGFFIVAIYNDIYLGICCKKYWRIVSGNPFKDDNIRELSRMIGPLLFGYSMIFINQQVDKIIVSGLGNGTLTAVSYGTLITNLITGLVGTYTLLVFPRITESLAKDNEDIAFEITDKTCILLITIVIPISIIAAISANPIMKLLFGHGEFDDAAVLNSANALMGYSFCWIPNVLKNLYSRFLYGAKNSKIPTINNTIGIVINIILSILLSKYFGVLGVTFSTGVAEWCSSILNIFSVKKLYKKMHFVRIFSVIPYWLVGSGLSILAFYLISNKQLFDSFLLSAVIADLLAVIIYMAGVLPILLKLKNR